VVSAPPQVHRDLSSHLDWRRFRRTTGIFERRSSVPFVAFSFLLGSRRLRQHVAAVAEVVRSASVQAQARTVVDSTKLLSRGLVYLMMRDPQIRVRYIHLVRDGIRHLDSRIARRNPGSEEPSPPRSILWTEIVGTLDWMYQNIVASILGVALKDRYLRVRYEDFVARPTETMERIGSFLGLDVARVEERLVTGQGLEPGHIIAGNRMKFQPALHQESATRNGVDKRARGFLFFRFVAGWLQILYGYHPSGGVLTGS
jgi:hypothetical protein